jgi:hypothetical protein
VTITNQKHAAGFPFSAFLRLPVLAAIAAGIFAAPPSARASASESLHARIDALLAEAHPEGQAPIANDADFLRRSYLALHGLIPTAARARAFFADTAPDKRAKLIDELLADPQFARWMAVRFDVMLMERRGETHTKSLPWREWLEQSFLENKPWNLLVSEIITADGGDEKTRHLARWLLEREADQHTLAKDVARLFLGKDLGCAQCHDHPRIDDYLQRDYAGLQAFFSRTYLFRPDEAKPGWVGEQAAGETTYSSVFTKVSGGTKPRLIGEPEVNEPPGGEWSVPPNPKDKKVLPIPKQSRRALLAEAFREGKNQAFRQNIANRLWALVFGRGLVEPLDLQHSANPPAIPALLDLLSGEIATMKFDMKAFVRELALTDAFQRTLDVPELPAELAQKAAEKAATLETQAKELASALEAAEAQVSEAQKAMLQVQRAAEPMKTEKAKQDTATAEVRKAMDAAAAEQKKTEEALAAKRDVQKALADAAAKINEAIAKAGERAELVAAAKTFVTKAEGAASEIPAIENDMGAKKSATEAKAQALAAAQQAAADAKAKLDQAMKAVAEQQAAFDVASDRKRAERTRAKHAAALAAQVRAAIALSEALAANTPAREAAAKAEAALAAVKQSAATLSAEISAAPAKLTALESTASAATAELNKAKEGMTAKGPAATAIGEASAKATEAASKLPKDEELKNAAASVKALADSAAAELAALQKTASDAQAKSDMASQQIAEAKAAAEKAAAELANLQPKLASLEAEAASARTRAGETSIPVATAREALASAWGRSFAANELLPLSPEQLCWSVLQASGQFEPYRAAAVTEWDAKNKLSDEDKKDAAKVATREAAIDKLYREKIRAYESQFVRSFGGAPGQPQTDFFATPEQALYFENGGAVRSWAAALANRAAAAPEPKAVAEELYLATLTRMPGDVEIAEVASALSSTPPEKKAQVLTDYTWALLTSVEFRFSH